MKKVAYRFLLHFLRSLIYVKRAGVWAFARLGQSFRTLNHRFTHTIGFRIHKVFFLLKRRLRVKFPWSGGLLEFLGHRATLQAVVFVVLVILMVPHSKLYARTTEGIAGRQTLLYRLVGPGDQDFYLDEEITADIGILVQKDTRSYKEGAVTLETPGASDFSVNTGPHEISGIAAGGSALTTPTILPGYVPGEIAIPTNRSAIVYYDVQPGDVVGKIAESYGISVETILWANNLSSRSYIRPGDQLKILPVSGVVHKVAKGDTIRKLASAYGADVLKIIEFNDLQNEGANIVIGEELIIPDGTLTTPGETTSGRKYSGLSKVSAPPPSVTAPAGSGYLWPTAVRTITQYFGWRHTAVDIAGPVGTPTYASRSGTVIKASYGWNGGYGNYIIIDHGDGVQTLYAHHSELFVAVGDTVVQGQTIGAMGSTGRSTGPHVHFEVRVNGTKENPLKYIK